MGVDEFFKYEHTGKPLLTLYDALILLQKKNERIEELELTLGDAREALNSAECEIEKLQSRLKHLLRSKVVQDYDEVCPRTKKYLRNIQDLDRLAEENTREKAIKEFLKAIEDAISNLEYNVKLKRKTVTVDMLLDQVNWVLHTIVPRRIKQVAADLLDDFPNCKISGCSHGKEDTSENS